MLRQSAICFFFFFLRCSSTQEFYFRRRQTEIANEKILKSLFGNENLRGIRILIRIFMKYSFGICNTFCSFV